MLMKNLPTLCLWFSILCSVSIGYAQLSAIDDERQSPDFFSGFKDEIRGSKGFRIVFYNLENFYDTVNDPLKQDEEFTPEGAKGWDSYRFRKKLNNTYKTLIATGGWVPPEIIGMCEIENRYVLDKIFSGTPIKTYHYQVIHHDSPDERGVDVALVYRPDRFTPYCCKPVRVCFPGDSAGATRDILYVKGTLSGKDTLHLFVNHWPSRYGGYMASMINRSAAAAVLRRQVDSLFAGDKLANIVIMGDFNDEPADESILHILQAHGDTSNLQPGILYNLMPYSKSQSHPGTIKFRDQWFTFDQFIVSGSVLLGLYGIKLSSTAAGIFFPSFLLEKDDAFFGFKPYRTFTGPSYKGGFSDHLPVYLDLEVNW